MANTYWVTFRIEERGNAADRYANLMEGLRSIASDNWWTEPTSFVLFPSDLGIDDVAETVNASIDPSMDIALVGMPDFKTARLIGASTDEDLFHLMPFTKKL